MSLMRTNRGLRTRSRFPRTWTFEDFFGSDWPTMEVSSEMESEWIPAANVKETEKEYQVELCIPGYTKKDIHVEITGENVLRITGEREDKSVKESENYTRKEFRYGSFSRSFELPETVNEEKIAANCADGVLKVTLPKKETAVMKEKVKEIKVA